MGVLKSISKINARVSFLLASAYKRWSLVLVAHPRRCGVFPEFGLYRVVGFRIPGLKIFGSGFRA